jgi:hypothetical protein
MSVDYRLRQRWLEAQHKLPRDSGEVLQMLNTFCARVGESVEDHRARLARENDEYVAEMDRLEEGEHSAT